MATKIELGTDAQWGVKNGGILAYNRENSIFKAIELQYSGASSKTRVNEQGVIETVASGVPRIDYTNGVGELLLEPQSTNLFLNSETGATQTITVVASSTYAVSFSGTGTITFSGGATGSLVGTGSGATDRVSTTITPTSTSVTCTISGTVEYVNFELGTYDTSWIPTLGTTATRIADAVPGNSSLGQVINSSEGVLYFEGSALADSGNSRRITLYEDTLSSVRLEFTSSGIIQCVTRASGSNQSILTYNTDLTQNLKIALKWKENDFALWVNGIEQQTDPSGLISSSLSKLSFDNGLGADNFYGRIKDLRVFDTALTDAELQTLTTL